MTCRNVIEWKLVNFSETSLKNMFPLEIATFCAISHFEECLNRTCMKRK